MKSPNELEREVEQLRNRISKLSSACLRISASLDLGTVLREIVEAARDLTGARLAGINTVGEWGQPEEFVTSGYTPDEHRLMATWADGPRLFEHFRNLPGPIRLPDLVAHIRSLGFSFELTRPKTFQGTPMRHGGMHVGNFYLGDKEGGQEFNDEDEEVLVLFAAQAATAVVNARRYRAEERARADLEALVNTSPVAVAVFDAPTGSVVSLNEEARRLAGRLLTPGSTPEQLVDLLTVRRADGREHALTELPLAEVLQSATSVRAEEVVLRVPDGRSVTTLVNATPIRSKDGEVGSVVVTFQDLSPAEGLERLRAEFLGMVSHELRVPLTSIMGSAATVLRAPTVLEPVEMLQFFRIIDQQASHMAGLVGDLLDVGRIETGTLSVSPEPIEAASLVDEARNTFLSGGGKHAVEIDLPMELPWVLADRRRIVQVLNNLMSNAAKHSPETAPIRISARLEGVFVEISVADEGRGVSPDRLPQLFRKYKAAEGEDAPPSAGLGLAISKGLVEAHGGRVWAESGGTGQGTRISFTVPVAEARATRFDRALSASQSPRGAPKPILVVDDDPETLRYVRNTLTAAGFSPLVTGNPEEVASLIKTRRPQLVLLDLVLPGTDGIALMDEVPALADPDLPVIFISAYGRDETIARALKKGAADYIVKPFSPTELVARIEAALRTRDRDPEPFRLGELCINYAEREVTVSGRSVDLTATEFDVLRELSLKAGRVLTYDTLLRKVWGQKESADAGAVRSFVKKLRRKLGDSTAKPKYIFTVHRVGYRMAKPVED